MRKVQLTPLQNRINWILEEAGEESLGTLIATLYRQGECDDATIRGALAGLQQLGFVVVADEAASLTTLGYEMLTK